MADPREYELGVLANTPGGWEELIELTRARQTGSVTTAELGTVSLSLEEILGS